MDFNLFDSFVFMINKYYLIFDVILALFLAQNFETKSFDSAKKSTFRMSGSMILIILITALPPSRVLPVALMADWTSSKDMTPSCGTG